MSEERGFQKYASLYDPIKVGSIDGTDTRPHDRALIRALNSEYEPYKRVKGKSHHVIFVARLNPRTTQDTIEAEFRSCGKVVFCRLVTDIVTGKSKQYAFIEFESTTAVERALRLHGTYIDNAEIIVEKEAERRLKGWKPRRLGGGFGGKKESGQLRFGCRDRPFRKPICVLPEKKNYE